MTIDPLEPTYGITKRDGSRFTIEESVRGRIRRRIDPAWMQAGDFGAPSVLGKGMLARCARELPEPRFQQAGLNSELPELTRFFSGRFGELKAEMRRLKKANYVAIVHDPVLTDRDGISVPRIRSIWLPTVRAAQHIAKPELRESVLRFWQRRSDAGWVYYERRFVLTDAVRSEVLAEGRCAECDGPATQVDHIQPIARGGTDEMTNLRPICNSCNQSKGTRYAAA